MKKILIILALILPLAICNAQENEDFDPAVELQEACKSTLKAWNDALNDRDEDALDAQYASVVIYYQTYYMRNQVRNSHSRFFKKNAFYHQYYDNVEVLFVNGCQAMLSFDKHVKTVPDGDYKTYHAYLRFISDAEGALITEEGDTTTDENLAKKPQKTLEVDNATSLDAIFHEDNVGKKLNISYWDLVEMGEKDDGPLANMIASSGFLRSFIDGTIKKSFDNEKGTYYCGGHAVGGECDWPVIFVYNPSTKEMRCVGAE